MREQKNFFQRFVQNKAAVVGLIGVLLVLIFGLTAPLLYEFPTGYGSDILQAPSKQHWFGTDSLGLDVFAELAYGAKTSFYVSLMAVLVAALIGIPSGLISGFWQGKVGAVIDSLIEIFLTLPMLPLIIVIAAVAGSSITNVAVVIGCFSWPALARVTRNSTMKIKEMQYIEVARSLNVPTFMIIFKHILSNVIGPICVNLILVMANAVMSESGLSFLGLGDPTVWSWGSILKRAWDTGSILASPNPYWWWLSPSLMIILYVVCFNLLGNGISEALNPRSQSE